MIPLVAGAFPATFLCWHDLYLWYKWKETEKMASPSEKKYCVVYYDALQGKWYHTIPVTSAEAKVRKAEYDSQSWCGRAMTAKHDDVMSIGLPEGPPQ